MKKRAISLFLAVSMSFTLFYPELSLNDNVLECVSDEESESNKQLWDSNEISLTELLRMPKSEKKYKLRLLEWFSEICR
ncbi:MAG: hypothetical protein IJ274_08945 [Lachnospiraceae bacterium]|nr:hypothetical protein [Lachnospiraceae bacterium]